MPRSTLFTVGHGARPIDALIEILLGARIDALVDVRRYPGSQRHPHFARDSLAASLLAAGVAYEWRGDVFGGRRRALPRERSRHPAWRVDAFRAYAEHMDSASFRAALHELEERARRIALLCSETLWWRCHRRLMADALVVMRPAAARRSCPPLQGRGPATRRTPGRAPSSRRRPGGRRRRPTCPWRR